MSWIGRGHPAHPERAIDSKGRPLEDHLPRRGSDVEAYLKAFRDRRPKTTPWFVTVDRILDDYRLRADTGLPLHADISLAGESGQQP